MAKPWGASPPHSFLIMRWTRLKALRQGERERGRQNGCRGVRSENGRGPFAALPSAPLPSDPEVLGTRGRTEGQDRPFGFAQNKQPTTISGGEP